MAVAALAALTATFAPAPAALAHDQVIDQSPSRGEHLTEGPTEITLTFIGEPLTLGALMMVLDASGADWADGTPQIVGTRASQRLTGALPDGHYEVRWRIVSGDGHPISEAYRFSVGDLTSAARLPDTRPDATTPTGEVRPTASTEANSPADQADAESTPGIPRIVIVALLGAAIAVGGFALARTVTARSRSTGLSDDSTTTPPHHPR